MAGRVIALWLDGFDMALADSYALPALADLQRRGTVATLDHGTAHLTGLTGEHLSSGLDPHAAARVSAVRFDPQTYRCVQEGTRHAPVFGNARTVMFDMAYFDLDRSSDNVDGISDWGVHDPGGRPRARPESLSDEIQSRFGSYPARRWIYGVPWASGKDCAEMGRALTSAANTRARIATWLLGERFPDWDLALIGFSEPHSASEGLFHGSGSAHPWAGMASAPEATVALHSVYSAVDRAVGEIVHAFPDDTVVVFSMHGMGPNSSDVPSMSLLGELLARWADIDLETARPFPTDANGIPILPPHMGWTTAVLESLTGQRASGSRRVMSHLKYRVPPSLRTVVSRVRRTIAQPSNANEGSLAWMPLMRHQSRWSQMRAFALPSFYDGRIRVNLEGREASGVVAIDAYDSLLDDIDTLLRACTEPRTGRPVVASIERTAGDPLGRADDDVDLIVHWAPDVLGIEHPEIGVIGPLPPRRTGGHASPMGRCIIIGRDVPAAHLGVRSSFDVVPTLFSLAGTRAVGEVSGRTLLDARR